MLRVDSWRKMLRDFKVREKLSINPEVLGVSVSSSRSTLMPPTS